MKVKKVVVICLSLFLLVVLGGALVWWRMSPKKPELKPGAACPPVRTALAALALVENPTAKTYAAFGLGVGAFTNVFAQAGLIPLTNKWGAADLVFVSGESTGKAICRAKEWCSTNAGILAIHYDVRKTSFKAFQRELAALPRTWPWRLWFPGRSDCLVVVRPSGASRPRLVEMMDLFAREGLFDDFARAGIGSLPSLFASFVGAATDVMPVFGFAQGEVVPECFVLKEVPSFDWIDPADVDADIRDGVFQEIRSMQVIRRMILEGDICSRVGDRDGAMGKWTQAIKRNPDDPLILERICLLDVNAETFLKVGNLPMAAQCLETMLCLRPKDAKIARRLALVMKQLGKGALSEQLTRRADELTRAELTARRGLPTEKTGD